MTSGQDVVETITSLINSNITDINTERLTKGLKWIYDTLPAMDITGYPRIGVINPTSSSFPHELGSINQRFSPRVEIQIRVKKGTNYTINSIIHNDIQTLNYLSEQISDLLRDPVSRSTMLSNDSVFYSILESENTIYDEIMIRQLIYKNILVR